MERSAETALARYGLPDDLASKLAVVLCRWRDLMVVLVEIEQRIRLRLARAVCASQFSGEVKTPHPSHLSTNHALYPRSVLQEYACPEEHVRELEKPARR